MLKSKKSVLLVVLLCLAAASVWYAVKAPTVQNQVAEGSLVETPPKDLLERIKQVEAKVTLVNIWASWCAPCIEELPLLVKLREQFKDEGLELILYSADSPKDKAEVVNFLKDLNIEFTTYFKGEASMDELELLFPEWAGALPASILYDSEGKIIQKWIGTASYEEFKSMIHTALKN